MTGFAARLGFAVALFACAAGMLAPATASAQAWPARPLRVIVPYAPGGTVDTVARVMAQDLSETLGQQVVVENRSGASGTIGSDLVAKSAPDGYTLLVNASLHIVTPMLVTGVPYDPVKDFTQISFIGSVPLLMIANTALPANNFREFVALVKANPGKHNFASSGTGAAGHLAEEMVKKQAGLDIQIITYRGTAPGLVDLISGNISALIDPLPATYPQVRGGKAKALAVTSSKRLAILPDVPTIAESGLPGFEMGSWYGLWGPPGLPRDIVNRLSAGISKAVKSKLATERLAGQAFEPAGTTPEEFAAIVQRELATYTQVIRDAGIKPQQN
jgi:tripartite-type tricarboxylate transporter receptor subunit TctC